MGDMAGLDIGWEIRKRRYIERPNFLYSKVGDKVAELGRFGQKTGKGWYLYEAGNRKPIPDPLVDTIVADYRKANNIPTRSISDEEIVERLIYSLVNEAAYILEEGIALRASDIDMVLGLGSGDASDDALYDQAVAIVARDRKCSTSYIQRKLGIGYNKAARLVEQMEEQGVVTRANHVGKREILVEER